MSRINQNSIKRILASLIIAGMVLPIGGCVRVNNAWNEMIYSIRGEQAEAYNTNQKLKSVELMQRLTASIRGDSDLAQYYRSIPARQLDDLSMDEFQRYIRLLRRGISGDVHSFTPLSEDELNTQKQAMLEQLPQQRELIESSTAYWILYRQSGRTDERFAFYLQLDEAGDVYLSADWVRRVLQIADYTTLYFDAIDTSNADALAFLIDQKNPDDPVVHAKAARLIEFYNNSISSRTSEYSLSTARMDTVAFDQFGITNPDLTQSVSRTVSFKADDSGMIRAVDVVQDVLKPEDTIVQLEDDLVFQFAAMEEDELVQVSSYRLDRIIGDPFFHNNATCSTYAEGVSVLRLTYRGMILNAQGRCQNHVSWDGVVRGATITGVRFTLGSGLGVGQPVENLLLEYPFAAEAGYRLKGQFEGGRVNLNVTIDDGLISQMEFVFTPRELA